MRLPFLSLSFTLEDAQEITLSARDAFISTFYYKSSSSENDSTDMDMSDMSDDDLDLYDPSTYGCGEITPAIENFVEDTWEACDPIKEVYGDTTYDLVKTTVQTAKEETQCAGLKFFKEIVPTDDKELLDTCTEVSYWCCCETIKNVSPIIADATTNLFADAYF